jgi:hypothetical protein
MHATRRISDVLYALHDQRKAEAEICNFRRLQQSRRYTYLSDGGKDRLSAHLVKLEARGETKKRHLEATNSRLMEHDSWSICREVEGDLAELQGMVAQLQSMTVGYNAAKDDPPRRPDQLQFVLDQLAIFDTRLSELENDLSHQDEDVDEDIGALVQSKKEDLDNMPAARPAISVETTNAINQQVSQLQAAEQHVNHTGEQLGLIAEEVGGLILQSNSMGKGISQLHDGVQQLSRDREAVSIL